MKLLYLRYEPTHSDFILDASAIKTIVPVGNYQMNVEWNSHRKLKFPKVKLSKMFVMNMMIINGKSHLAI